MNHKQLAGKNFSIRTDILIGIFLVFATLSVYWQVKDFEFVSYDDNDYITANAHVQKGLTWDSVMWVFTTGHSANWHPLTWLSHMLDIQLYGLSPGPHHITNVLFHMANTLLLFVVLRRMTGSARRSGLVAALFALHPLHVQSVAWVAERKDVLSTFFWMLTLAAYTRYAEHPGRKTYLPVLLFFMLGLMSKPMVVTLPFVLFLLDYWPLGRIRQYELGIQELRTPISDLRVPVSSLRFPGADFRGLILEKLPLFMLSALSSWVTFLVQQDSGAVKSLEKYPFYTRAANALVSYAAYIGKMICPRNLSYFYPYPDTVPVWQIAGAGLFIAAVFFLMIRSAKRHPYFPVGWLWYMGTLVPVIGLVQVGGQSMADRYTYIPFIGLFIIIAWGIPEFISRRREIVLGGFAAGILSVLMIITYFQIKHWRNSITLFEHAIEITENNAKAHSNLGYVLLEKGNLEKAASHFKLALKIKPYSTEVHNNMGIALARLGRKEAAEAHFREALQIEPDDALANYNLGIILNEKGDATGAVFHFQAAIAANPRYTEAHYNLGNLFMSQRRIREAGFHFQKVLEFHPNDADAHNQLGIIFASLGKRNEALVHFRNAARIHPADANIRNNLGLTLLHAGKTEEAVRHFQAVLRIHPENADARNYLEKAQSSAED